MICRRKTPTYINSRSVLKFARTLKISRNSLALMENFIRGECIKQEKRNLRSLKRIWNEATAEKQNNLKQVYESEVSEKQRRIREGNL